MMNFKSQITLGVFQAYAAYIPILVFGMQAYVE